MKPRVYLETSFISYLVSKASREPVTAQRQFSSNYWWTAQRARFELCISARVFQECQGGEPDQAQKRIAPLSETKLFPLNEEIIKLSEYFACARLRTACSGLRCDSYRRCDHTSLRLLVDLEFSSYCKRDHSSKRGKDYRETWLPTTNHLHSRRTQ